MKVATIARSLRRRLFLQTLEDRATPATFTVTNTGDNGGINPAVGAGTGTLRQAIVDANADTGTSESIDVTGVTGTISLQAVLPTITKNTTVSGPGSSKLTVTRGVAADFRILNISAAGTINVSVSGMSLTNGSTTGTTNTNNGGCINIDNEIVTLNDVQCLNNKTARAGGAIAGSNVSPYPQLTMNNCVISGNQALGTTADSPPGGRGGAIYFGNNGVLNMTGCTVSGNTAKNIGGGIYFFSGGTGVWNITSSTFSGNTAQSGGAMILYGSGAQTLTILNSTLSGNTATGGDTPGGIGGAVASYVYGNNTVVIRISTITGNTAAGGGGAIDSYVPAGKTGKTNITVQNSTVVNNSATAGGAIFSANGTDNINVESSIFKNSASSAGPDFDVLFTTVNAKTSLIFNNTGASFNADAFTNANFGVDAKLGSLANNGGPTQTYLPQAGSPAIDNGSNPALLATDQRGPGFLRTFPTNATDIGSVEIQPFGLPTASISSLPNVLVPPGGTTYTLKVSYQDDTAIKVSSLNTGDVTVTGPNGFSVNPTFVSVDVNSDGTPRVATYTFTAPGGSWGGSNVGKYVVSVNASQVQDNSGNSILPGSLGSFQVVAPTTFVVNSTGDEAVDTDGKLSLREAVLAAEANTPASDTITFDPTVFASAQTITLNSVSFGAMSLTDRLTVNGPGAKLTLDGGGSAEHFLISAATTLSVNGLTFTNGGGANGGAISIGSSGATLNVTNSVFNANKSTAFGGAIGQAVIGGVLSVINVSGSTFTNNVAGSWGGAIGLDADAAGTTTGSQLTIDRCTFDGNSNAGNGGAIADRLLRGGNMTVTNSTFTNNTATANGGALSFLSAPNAGTVLIQNCTISGNSATTTASGGGAFASGNTFDGKIIVQNSTIAFNKSYDTIGGAIARTSGVATVSLESTIIYNNTNTSTTGVPPDFSGAAVTAKNCIIFSSAGAASFTDLGGNLFGAAADPLLGPLTNNGGPTQTHLPGSGSPAREAGSNPGSLTTDQRGSGFPRTLGSKTDIGAVESLDPIPIAALSASNVLTGGATSYTFSVTYSDDVAIKVSTLNTGDVTVSGPNGFTATPTFLGVNDNSDGTPRVATYSFTPPGGTWDTADDGTYSVSVVGGQVTDNVGNAVKAGQVGSFAVSVPLNLVVNATNDESTDTDGKTSLREAILKANGTTPSNDVITFDATVFGGGGKITLSLGEILVSDSVTVTGLGASKVTIDGGGASRIFNLNGPGTLSVSLSGVTLSGGFVTGDGGAILDTDETLSLSNVTLTGNSATGSGGAVSINQGGGSINASDSTFTANTAGNGGAFGGTANSTNNFVRCVVSGNTATNGGGLYFNTGNITVDSTEISGNTATNGGGVGAANVIGKMTFPTARSPATRRARRAGASSPPRPGR